jgi:hypothetical protein
MSGQNLSIMFRRRQGEEPEVPEWELRIATARALIEAQGPPAWVLARLDAFHRAIADAVSDRDRLRAGLTQLDVDRAARELKGTAWSATRHRGKIAVPSRLAILGTTSAGTTNRGTTIGATTSRGTTTGATTTGAVSRRARRPEPSASRTSSRRCSTSRTRPRPHARRRSRTYTNSCDTPAGETCSSVAVSTSSNPSPSSVASPDGS